MIKLFKYRGPAKHEKDITTQFFVEIPKVMEEKGYYDWASANLKRYTRNDGT